MPASTLDTHSSRACCTCWAQIGSYTSLILLSQYSDVWWQVRIKLKYMELEIRRREMTGSGSAKRTEVETLGKYEIMDGAPVRGEAIPIR